MDMSKYREMFLTEAREHLANMSKTIVVLEKDPSDREGIDALFRQAHSIKGMAASMGYETTAGLAHNLEDLMDSFRKTGTISAEAVDRLLEGIDLLEGLLDDLEGENPERNIDSFLNTETESSSATTPETLPLQPAPEKETQRSAYRITIDLAPGTIAPAARFLLITREIKNWGTISSSSPTEEQLASGHPVYHLDLKLETSNSPANMEESLLKNSDVEGVKVRSEAKQAKTSHLTKDDGPRTVRVSTELLDRFINLTGELITNRYMLQTALQAESWPQTKAGLHQLSRLINDLHHQVLQVRMMPVESITGRLPRLVRELCRKTGKDVELKFEGVDVELDRAILEELSDPLVHMLRNAIDHGIEKSGSVQVTARREKDLVILEVADDGKGMDPRQIRDKAIERGIISTTQAKALSERDIFQLVCIPGFSTAASVTDTSGRGVGMDVVKSSVERLGGSMEIRSAQNEGTQIRLKFPLSVAIIQVLLVESNGNTLAIPITRVFRTMEIAQQDIHLSGKKKVIRQGDEIIPLIPLRHFLRSSPSPEKMSLSVVLTESRGRKLGLIVDRLIGQRVVFVKTLAFPLDRLPGISGATILGDGSVVFIIDPHSLLEKRIVSSTISAQGEA